MRTVLSRTVLWALLAASSISCSSSATKRGGPSEPDYNGQSSGTDVDYEKQSVDSSVMNGYVSPHKVESAIFRSWDDITDCYRNSAGPGGKPTAEGAVTVDFLIGKGGKAIQDSIRESSVHNKSIETCLLATIKQVEFPEPEGGERAKGSYTFYFNPNKKVEQSR